MRTRDLAVVFAPLLAVAAAGTACRQKTPIEAAPSAAVAPAALITLAESNGATRMNAANQAVAVNEPLRAGDVLTVGPKGGALLRLGDGRTLALEPDSRVRIKTASAGEIAVEIESGMVTSRVPAQLADSVVVLDILTPLGIVHVPNAPHESSITVRPERVSVAVALGQINFVDRQGQPIHAIADQRVEVSLGGIEVLSTKTNEPLQAKIDVKTDPSTLAPGEVVELDGRLKVKGRRGAEVALPPARGLRIYSDTLAQVNLTWPADLTDPVVEVASDSRFEKLTLMARPTGTSLRVPAPRRGQQIAWRISGTSGGARRTLHGQARFLPDRARSLLDLAHPRNLVAETGQVTTVYFQSVLPALTFSYAAKPGASAYRVQVFRAGALKKPVHEQQAKQTTCALAAGILGEGSYLWHAVALDDRGQDMGGGLMNKLEIVYDNPLNTLAIGSPKPGEAVQGSEVDVTGAAPVGSRLFVNGRPVPLDPKGRFEVRIERSPSLVFRLVAHDGSESYWVRQLRTRS